MTPASLVLTRARKVRVSFGTGDGEREPGGGAENSGEKGGKFVKKSGKEGTGEMRTRFAIWGRFGGHFGGFEGRWGMRKNGKEEAVKEIQILWDKLSIYHVHVALFGHDRLLNTLYAVGSIHAHIQGTAAWHTHNNAVIGARIQKCI